MNTATLDSDTTTGDTRTVTLHFSRDGEAVPLSVTLAATSPYAVIRDPCVDEFVNAITSTVAASTPSRNSRRKSKRRR